MTESPIPPTPSRLERDSRVVRLDDGAFAADVELAWCIDDSANGGYALSLGLRALAEALPLPDPLTSTAHYLRPLMRGPVRIEVETMRIGRTLARGVARMLQDGQECVRVIAAFGTLPRDPGTPLWAEPLRGELAPLEECTPLVLDSPGGLVAHVRSQLDIRYDPGSVGWARGERTGRPVLSAWVRPADGSEPDGFLLPLVADAPPCTAFELEVENRVLTVEMTVHQRAVPAPGWLRCFFRSRLVADGFMEEDGEIWDASGRLVAMSRQLAVLPPRRA